MYLLMPPSEMLLMASVTDVTARNRPVMQSVRRGFTLVELLAVMVIIAILMGLLLPAIQSSRESARALTCRNRLAQIGIALHNYQSAHRVLPPGTQNASGPIKSNDSSGYHMGWMTQILPYLEQQSAYHRIDFTRSVHDPANATIRNYWISEFACPSAPLASGLAGLTSYFGVHNDVETPIDVDQNGVLFLNSSIREDDIPDGVSNTCFVLEGPPIWGVKSEWMPGTRYSLRNAVLARPDWKAGEKSQTNYDWHPTMLPFVDEFSWRKRIEVFEKQGEYVGGGGSFHHHGSHFLLGDGAVRMISNNIDIRTLRNLAHRADGELIGQF